MATKYNFQQIVVPGAEGGATAYGINDRGEISGAFASAPGGATMGFTLANGALTPLTGGIATSYGINTQGDTAIQAGTEAYLNEVSSYLPLGGDTAAYDINDKWEMVGTSGTVGVVSKFAMPEEHIVFPGADWTQPRGINDSDTVVGTYGIGTHQRAFVYSGGQYQTIRISGAISGAVTAQANDVSNTGEIVGTYQDAAGHDHGWVDLAGHISKVDVPGSTATFIYGVNDFQQVVGAYTVAGDPFKHAFVATPTSERLPSGTLSLPQIVYASCGMTAGSMYYDPTQPFMAAHMV